MPSFLDTQTDALLDEAAKNAGYVSRLQQLMPTVLLVEDDPISVQVTHRQLRRAKVRAFFATNYVDALKKYEEVQPDVVIVDINIPRREGETALPLGADVVAAIRDMQAEAHPQIVVLTGSEDQAQHTACMRAGADDVLLKSEAPALLSTEFSRLAAQVRSSLAVSETVNKVAVVMLDLRRITVEQTDLLMQMKRQQEEQALQRTEERKALAPLLEEHRAKQEAIRTANRVIAFGEKVSKPVRWAAVAVLFCATVVIFVKTGKWPHWSN